MATEHIFKAGHRIGVILGARTLFGTAGTGNGAVAVTVDTQLSKVKLPILGGYHALASAGGTDAETVAPSLGAVGRHHDAHGRPHRRGRPRIRRRP